MTGDEGGRWRHIDNGNNTVSSPLQKWWEGLRREEGAVVCVQNSSCDISRLLLVEGFCKCVFLVGGRPCVMLEVSVSQGKHLPTGFLSEERDW